MSKQYRTFPRIYWWIKWKVGDKQGILGYYRTEQLAQDKAETLRGAKYKVVPLDTKNKSAASSKLKAVVLDETHDLSISMQRMSRKEPTDEMLREDKQTIHWL